MTISLRATATGSIPSSYSNTVWTVTMPSFQAGDVVVVDMWGVFNGAVANTPSGWTQLIQDNTGGGGAGTGPALARFYRVMQAGDPSTVTWTATYGAPWTWVASSWIGVNNAGPIDANSNVQRSATTSSVTTAHGSAMLLPMWCNTTAFSILSNPVGTTRAAYATSTDTWSRGLDLESKAAGAAGLQAAMAMPDTNNNWTASHLFALNAQAPPLAPTPTNPAPASSQNLAAGFTFNWTYNPATSGVAQTAYAFRRKVGAGAYEWWNAGTLAWQSTEIFNTSTTPAVTFGSGKWTNGTAYTWSVATQDSNGTGAYSADTAVTGSTPPVVTVTGPPNPVAGATPSVTWTEVLQTGSVQTAYRVIIESGAFGATPGSGVTVWDSGVVLSTALSATAGVALANGGSYRAFVIVTQTGAQSSPWTTRDFTVTYNTPGTPGIVAVWDSTLARCAIAVQNRDNILSANMSSVETSVADWAAYSNCTIARSTTQALDGSASIAVTATAAGDVTLGPVIFSANTAVTPGKVYTATASFRAATVARAVRLRIDWYTAGGSPAFITNTIGLDGADNTAGWQQVTASGQAPANAAYAQPVLVVVAPAAGEVHYVDAVGLFPDPLANFAFNSDFENGVTPWASTGAYINAGSTIAQDATRSYTGRSSLAVTTTAATQFQGASTNTLFTTVLGGTYTASAWVYSVAATVIDVVIGGTGGQDSHTSTLAVPAATWTRISSTLTATSSYTCAVTVRRSGGAAVASTFWVDAVRTEVGATATAYVPPTYSNLLMAPSSDTVNGTYVSAPQATVTSSTEQALIGSTSFKCVGANGMPRGNVGLNNQLGSGGSIGPAPGTYTASVYVYNPSVNGFTGGVFLSMQGYAGGTYQEFAHTADMTTVGAWTRLSVTFTLPANYGQGGGDATLRFFILNSAAVPAGAVFYADGWQIELGNVANPYVDGAQGPGYSWEASQNLLSAAAASFEDGSVGGWTAWTGITAVNATDQAFDGTHSLKATWSAAHGSLYTLVFGNSGAAAFKCIAGTTYTASLFVRTDVQRNITVTLTDNVVANIAAPVTVLVPANTWTRIVLTGAAVSSQTIAGITVQADTTTTTGTVWIDAVQIEQRNYATPYGQAGTANAATSTRQTPWTVGGFAGLTQTVVEESEDGGVTWSRVRQLASADVSGQLVTVYDYEAAPGVTRIYRASVRANWTNPATLVASRYSASSASIVATLLSAWLKDPLDPASNVALSCLDGITDTKGRNVAVLLPLGAKLPIVQSDVRRARTSTVSVTPATQAETDAINHLLDQPSRVLLLQQPAAKSPWRGRQMYLVATGDDTSAPIGDVPADNRTLSFPVAEVRAPAVV